MRKGKGTWLLLIFLVVGAFIGSLLGQALGGSLPWLNLSSNAYGITSPLVLNLGLFVLTIGFTVRLTVAGLIGLVIGLFIFVRL